MKSPQRQFEFAKSAKLPQRHAVLDEERVGGQRATALLPGRKGPLRQTQRLVETAVHQRPLSVEQQASLETVAQVGLDAQVFAVRHIRADDIARFNQVGDPIVSRLEREIPLAFVFGEFDHFARVGKPLLEAVRVSQRQPTAPERHDRRVRIVEPAGHLGGLLAQRDSLVALRPVEFDPQSCERLGEEPAVGGAEHRPRFLEKLHEAMIGHAGEAENPTGRKNRAGEQIGPPDATRDVGGSQRALAGRGDVARLDLRLGEVAEQFRQDRIVASPLEREGLDGVVEMAGRLLVGQLLLRGLRRPPRIVDRGVRVSRRGALAIVIGDLGERLARRVEAPDRFRDDAMEAAAFGRGQTVVERFADERVAEGVASRHAAHLVDKVERIRPDRGVRSNRRARRRSRLQGS